MILEEILMARKRKKGFTDAVLSRREQYILTNKLKCLRDLNMEVTEENLKKVTICTMWETLN